MQGEQLVVRAALDDLTIFQHHDGVGVADGGETVRDDKGGTVGHQAIHAVLDVPLGARVDRGGRLIEDENRRLGEGGARDV